MKNRILTLTVLSALQWTPTVQALDVGHSHAEFTIQEGQLIGEARFAWEDIDSVLEIDLNHDAMLDDAEFSEAQRYLSDYGETLYHLQHNGRTVSPPSVTTTWNTDLGALVFQFKFQMGTVSQASDLHMEFAGHRDFPVGHRQDLKMPTAVQVIEEKEAHPWFPEPSPTLVLANHPIAKALTPVSNGPTYLLVIGILGIAIGWSFWYSRRLALR